MSHAREHLSRGRDPYRRGGSPSRRYGRAALLRPALLRPVLALPLALLAACGPAARAATAPHSPSASGPARTADRSAPDRVALPYTLALLSGNTPEAIQYVLPSEQQYLRIMTLGLTKAPIHVRNLAVGSTTVRGPQAVVVLTGTLCMGTPPGASPAPDSCVTNTDPASTNPVFRVSLAQGKDRLWYVDFPIPGTPGATAGGPAAGNGPAGSGG